MTRHRMQQWNSASCPVGPGFAPRKLAHTSMRALSVLIFSLFFSPPNFGQAVRVQARAFRLRPELVCLLCTLTVSATPTSVSFNLVQKGTAAASSSITITTTLTGISALGSLNLYGYLSSSSAALTDGQSTPDNIPSSAVLGKMPTGIPTSFTPFTGSYALGTAGATLELFSTSSLLSVGCTPSGASCRTDALSLEINLSSLPQLPAGTYHGTLVLQAEAM